MSAASERQVPWPVRYWLARLDAGQYLAPYQRLAVAMAYEQGGCASCARASAIQAALAPDNTP
jgi:hypothetical protein